MFGLLAVLTFSQNLHAWSERGHDLITRVAVQKMRADSADLRLLQPFLLRDHMLAHLSNTPDTVWVADYMSDEAKSLNSATQFIKLEKIIDGVERWDDFPRDFVKYEYFCKSRGFETSEIGTAPWRVLQFYKLVVNELRNLDAKPKLIRERHINQALTYAGLMAHFVGKLANPQYTTENQDGQLTGNAGLREYFDSMVVSELSFRLPQKILRKSKKRRLWLRNYSRSERAEILSDPQKLVWALVANSHNDMDALLRLDNRHSIKSKSDVQDNYSTSAERKPASRAARRYEKFVVKRMAIGAEALSRLWTLAWQDAGSPDMSGYQSSYYSLQPPFITPSYIEQN